MLIDQPTAAPTRKMWAVIVAAFIVNGALGVLRQFAPEIADAIPAQQYIDMLMAVLAGYMVRDRA